MRDYPFHQDSRSSYAAPAAPRLRSVITAPTFSSSTSASMPACSWDFDSRGRDGYLIPSDPTFPSLHTSSSYGRLAFDEGSEEDSDREADFNKNKEKSTALKTMEDGHVLLYSNSVNGREPGIPYPWLVFNEKVKVNSVFLRDSTAVSDSILLLFGENISRGRLVGSYHPCQACDYKNGPSWLRESPICCEVTGFEDLCQGRFVFGREVLKPKTSGAPLFQKSGCGPGGDNSKSQLQTLVVRAGYDAPTYQTKQLKNNQFRAIFEFGGMQFVGNPCQNKKLAEKDAASEALKWLTGSSSASHEEIEHMSLLLKKSKKQQQQRR